MLLNIEPRNEATAVARLSGALTHVDSADAILRAAHALQSGGCRALALDCSRINKVNAAGLSGLVDVLSQPWGLEFALFDISQPLQSRLSRYALEAVLPIFSDEAAALGCPAFLTNRLAHTRVILDCMDPAPFEAARAQFETTALTDFLGKPVFARSLEQLAHFGVREVLLRSDRGRSALLGHVPQIAANCPSVFLCGQTTGPADRPQGLAEFIYRVDQEHMQLRGDFIVQRSNGLGDLDLARAMDAHQSADADLTLATDAGTPAKAVYADIGRADAMIFSPRLMGLIADNLGTEAINLQTLLRSEQAQIQHVPVAGNWHRLDTIEDYQMLVRTALTKELAPLKPAGECVAPGQWLAEGATLSHRAKISGPIYLGRGARVEPGARIEGPASIGAGSVVRKGARLTACAVFPDSDIGADVRATGAVLAADSCSPSSTPVDLEYRPSATSVPIETAIRRFGATA